MPKHIPVAALATYQRSFHYSKKNVALATNADKRKRNSNKAAYRRDNNLSY